MGTGRGRASAWLAAIGALLVVAGLVAALLVTRSPTPGRVTASPVPAGDAGSGSPPRAGVPGTDSTPRPVLAERTPGAPRRVVIPALEVSAPVLPVQAPNDTLIPPADAEQLGWWADGARPGAARGSALIAGHTVHTGGGALHDLETLTPGQPILVRTDRGRVTYEVARVRTYSKGRLARDAERIFSQDVPGRLVLITCEDWDGSQFLSNVVVVASATAA